MPTLKYNTWDDYYRAKRDEGGAFEQLFEAKMGVFNETTLDHLNDSRALKLTIASHKASFILLPGTEKSLQLVHNVMLVPQGLGQDPLVICTQGNRSTSPFQVIPLDLITNATRSRRGTPKSDLRWTIPTLDQFLETGSEDEFSKLQAETGTTIIDETDFTHIPRHLFTHPLVFLTLGGRGNSPAKEAGFKVVQKLQSLQARCTPEDLDEVKEFVQSAHLLLGFIWAVSRGLIVPIAMTHPPELDNVEEVCYIVLRRIREDSEQRDEPKPDDQDKANPRRGTDCSPSPEEADASRPSQSPSTARKKSPKRGRRSPSRSTPKRRRSRSRSSRDSSSDNSKGSRGLPSSRRQNTATDLGGLTAALVQNMNELAASHLETKNTEAKKLSMMSRMGPETEKLFQVLSAKDWDERKPKLNSFMTRLMKDKGMSRACELVRSQMRRGEGAVTENGLIQFLSSGYLCKTMDEKPGGFTFFMFRPVHIDGGHNPRLMEQSIRETFGDAKLSEEIVRFYAKGNYFLPQSFPDFMIQLETCYRTLELFTCRGGVASRGYRLAYRLIHEQSVRYRPLFTTDPTLGIKIGRYLDNVFQNFCADLAEYVNDRDPLRSSRRRLEYRFEDEIQSFFSGIRNGVVPTILLPESLTPNSSVTGATDESGSKGGKPKQSSGPTGQGKGKVEPNPEAQTEWRIPPGKRFGDFFSPGRTDLKQNVTGWPMFPHHTAKVDRPMCLRFQTTGECTSNCTNSHILPSAMPAKTWEGIRNRLKKIISG
jgi:hypothetical protein